MSLDTRWRWFLVATFVILVGDVLSKEWILATLPYGGGFRVIDGFFNIVHARNTGAAFGFLHGADPRWTIPFFLGVGLLALGFLWSMTRRLPAAARVLPALLGGIAGGAVGNLLDRVRHGFVVDFLDFYVGNRHWPAFNVADIGISVGVTVLLLVSLRHDPFATPDKDE